MLVRTSATAAVLVFLGVLGASVAGCGGGGTETADAPPEQGAQEERLPAPPTSSVEHEVVHEAIDDSPIKTQVERHIVVEAKLSDEDLTSFLRAQLADVSAMRGFERREKVTHTGIFVYDSEDQARSMAGGWIGMLLKIGDGAPEITLAPPTPKPSTATSQPSQEERFGLSLSERKALYKEIVAAEDRGTLEANRREPNDFDRNMALEARLWNEYKNDLAKRHRLTRDQLEAISQEGIDKQWAM